MYCIKYSSHLKTISLSNKADVSSILGFLKDSNKSKLADRTQQQLPSPGRITTTFCNINWLLQYWMCRDPVAQEDAQGKKVWDHTACFPNPVCKEYGFAVGYNGKVAWLDSA